MLIISSLAKENYDNIQSKLKYKGERIDCSFEMSELADIANVNNLKWNFFVLKTEDNYKLVTFNRDVNKFFRLDKFDKDETNFVFAINKDKKLENMKIYFFNNNDFVEFDNISYNPLDCKSLEIFEQVLFGSENVKAEYLRKNASDSFELNVAMNHEWYLTGRFLQKIYSCFSNKNNCNKISGKNAIRYDAVVTNLLRKIVFDFIVKVKRKNRTKRVL